VRTLSPAQIAARLGNALKLLRLRSTSGAERHRSLEAAIRWSYDLLNDAERSVLTRSRGSSVMSCHQLGIRPNGSQAALNGAMSSIASRS
jgi:predicted ATPase